MKTGPWYRRYPSDFIGGVIGLGPDTIGCYAVVLDLIYDKGGPIPHDTRWLGGILGCSTRKAESLLRRLENCGKIIISNGSLVNRRAENELEKAAKMSRELSEAGAKGGRTRAENEAEERKNNELAEARLKQAAQASLEASTRAREEDKQQHPTEPERPVAAPASKPDAMDEPAEVAQSVQVGQRVVELMGVTNDPRWLGNWARTSAWIAEGFDPEQDIYPAVQSAMARRRERGEGAPNTLKYFDKMIRERHRERRGLDQQSYQTGNPAAVEYAVVKAKTPQFRAWIEHYRKTGRKTEFLAKQDSITVPTEWPPEQQRGAA